MSTEMSNPDGVVMLKDTATCGEPQPVLIEFQGQHVAPTTEREIVRVIVGPGPASDLSLVNQFRRENPLPSGIPKGSCNNGKACVVFVKMDQSGTVIVDNELNGLVGITEIRTEAGKNYPVRVVFTKEFYEFGPANRKEFAKLFC